MDRETKQEHRQPTVGTTFGAILDEIREGKCLPFMLPRNALLTILGGGVEGLEDEIGESLFKRRLVLIGMMCVSFAALVFSCVAAMLAFGWWGLIPVVVLLVLFRTNAFWSGLLPTLGAPAALCVVAAIAGLAIWSLGHWYALFAMSVPVPWLSQRIAARRAVAMVYELVLRNERALFVLLGDGGGLVLVEPPGAEDQEANDRGNTDRSHENG